ncbi:hypothetical protein Agub_g760 [Astrephomene gubernaculifera]|uniref:Uncharacterized protein n=1 Tax=Astrephomene gubernaculifera TaxID=47775 RepID=A0AAD3DEB3_9CHLO|nr:hypothetical protein Agub_g760 [Astrephomene gubernaculifera]
MVDAFVSGRQVPGALGATTTPPRGIALAGAAGASSSMAGAAAASPFSPAGAALSPLSSSLGSPSGPGGAAEEPEPRIVEVVEELLRLVDAVAASPDAPAVLEGNRLSVLMAAFNSGMPNFQGGGYRVAAECAQVLFRLSLHSAGALLSSLSGPHVTGPLAALVRRGKDYATAADAKQAQVLYGAWCAAGLLCQVLDAKRTQGRVQEVLHGDVLRCAVELLDGSAPALLAAVGVLPPPSGGGEGSLAAQAVGLAGLVFLSTERVTAALCAAASRLLSLLMELARDMANQQALRGMGAAKAAQQLLSWQQVQWSAKRLLHLMGIMEAEYQPFVRYGGPLLAALLGSQGVSAAPFLARGVDAHILLGLDDHYLRTQLGLDEVAVLKVARIRSAYSLFAAMDAEDGRMDGCVSAADVETYMQNRANMRLNTAVDLRERLFMELKVLPGEPICFMQFVNCFPWLDAELQAFMPHRLSPAGPADASRDPYAVQSTKRRRVGDAYGGGGAGGSGSAAAGRAGGAQVIEVD